MNKNNEKSEENFGNDGQTLEEMMRESIGLTYWLVFHLFFLSFFCLHNSYILIFIFIILLLFVIFFIVLFLIIILYFKILLLKMFYYYY